MTLDEYFKQQSGNHSRLSKETGIASSFLYQMAKGARTVPPRYCNAIEQFTNGAVTRRDLRPDDWAEIWPELKGDE